MLAKKLSAIIPSYKSRHLHEVIEAVRAIGPSEIIVVDSSSTAPEVSDPLVTVIRSEAPIPPGVARNRGAAKASGSHLLFVDSDVVLAPAARDFVNRHVAAGSDDVVSGVYAVEARGFFSRLQNHILRYRGAEGGTVALPLFSSSHFLIKRATFKSVGGFNETLSTYEDVEFLARSAKLGVRFASCADFEAVHRKEYSFASLLKDYALKAYNAFQVRRRYEDVFTGVPSMLGKDLQRAWLISLLPWPSLLLALALFGWSPLSAGVVGLMPLAFLYGFLRRLLKGEGPAAAALTVLYWPLMATAIAVAIALSACVWTTRRGVQLWYSASDMVRALKRVLIRTGLPVQVIAYVTARCNLRCEHCFYKETLDKPDWGELPLSVFERTTRSIGPVLWFSLAGGEPFVRKDLSQLIALVQANCRPKVFSFPTNGWYTDQTFETCLRVLQGMESGNLILFFSLDGPKHVHDVIRGSGSFDRVRETMDRLRPLTEMYPNLYLNVITTITERNADLAAGFVEEIIRDFRPSAISINLFRYHSLEHPPISEHLIEGYRAAVDAYSRYLREGALKHYGFFGGRILLFKEILQKELIYRVAKFNEFVTPCTAGTLSYVIMEDGRLTPCEILPDTIGNVTGSDSFRELVTGKDARRLRHWIAATNCKCTYECAMSTNTLFSWPMSWRMVKSLTNDLVFGKAAE